MPRRRKSRSSETRATIESLPAELIAEICEHVDYLSSKGTCPHHHHHGAAAGGPNATGDNATAGAQGPAGAHLNPLVNAFSMLFGLDLPAPPQPGPANGNADAQRTDPEPNAATAQGNGTATAAATPQATQRTAARPTEGGTAPATARSASSTAGAYPEADDDNWQTDDGDDDDDNDSFDGYDSDNGLADNYSDDYDSGERDDEDETCDCGTCRNYKAYPDGLPGDPMLPLAFVNRAFLSVVRNRIYKQVSIVSNWQAHLFLQSLKGPRHAAYLINSDEYGLPPGSHNVLPHLVKILRIDLGVGKEVSLRRGGGQTLLDIIKTCKNVESLTLMVSFLKSTTQQYLEALGHLRRLKTVRIQSGVTEHGMRLTTARLLKLVRYSWPDLEHLTVDNLESNELGPFFEEVLMQDDTEERAASGETTKLKTIRLINPHIEPLELDILLEDSRHTIKTFELSEPGPLSTPRTLAQSILSYGYGITVLQLDLSRNWGKDATTIVPPLAPGTPAPKVGPRKDYERGQPTYQDTVKVAQHPFFLNALLPYLPQLAELDWTGPIASANVFKGMAPTVTRVTWKQCPTLKPLAAAKVLKTKASLEVNLSDEIDWNSKAPRKAAPGLMCITVTSDDLSWDDDELAAMKDAAAARNCCLHLTSSAGAFFGGGGITIPLDLGLMPPGGGAGDDGAGQAGAGANGAGQAGAGANGAGQAGADFAGAPARQFARRPPPLNAENAAAPTTNANNGNAAAPARNGAAQSATGVATGNGDTGGTAAADGGVNTASTADAAREDQSATTSRTGPGIHVPPINFNLNSGSNTSATGSATRTGAATTTASTTSAPPATHSTAPSMPQAQSSQTSSARASTGTRRHATPVAVHDDPPVPDLIPPPSDRATLPREARSPSSGAAAPATDRSGLTSFTMLSPSARPPLVNHSTRPSASGATTSNTSTSTSPSTTTAASQRATPASTTTTELGSRAASPSGTPSTPAANSTGDRAPRPLDTFMAMPEHATDLTDIFAVPPVVEGPLRNVMETVLRTVFLRINDDSPEDLIDVAMEPMTRGGGGGGGEREGETTANAAVDAEEKAQTATRVNSQSQAAQTSEPTPAQPSAPTNVSLPTQTTLPASQPVPSSASSQASVDSGPARSSSAASPSAATSPRSTTSFAQSRTPRSSGLGRRGHGASVAASRTGRPWDAVMGDLTGAL
ncbi:hypothetical protein ACM66B_002798 [Microbotryomycetes sp. NB124-2]